jgi:hypothetical protein
MDFSFLLEINNFIKCVPRKNWYSTSNRAVLIGKLVINAQNYVKTHIVLLPFERHCFKIKNYKQITNKTFYVHTPHSGIWHSNISCDKRRWVARKLHGLRWFFLFIVPEKVYYYFFMNLSILTILYLTHPQWNDWG